jgi:hypothetical protein
MNTQEAILTTQEVADRLHVLLSQFRFADAQTELFHEDATSVEPAHSQGMPTVTGLDKIKMKGEEFQKGLEEVHSGHVSDPLVAGNYIAMTMVMDVTMKGVGRQKLEELMVYEVRDGKIAREQFLY